MFRAISRHASVMKLGTVWLLSIAATSAFADNGIVRIEEDWELHVTQPDEQLDAPQVSTMMVPFGGESDVLFQVDWNHATYPEFANGGFQVRISADDQVINDSRHFHNQRLNQESETLRWTQVVQEVEGGFIFGLVSGSSDSWGTFGGGETFVWLSEDEIDSPLSSYSSNDSLQNSGVTYAGNRVSWLRLKRVRVYDALGQFTETVLNVDAN